MKMNPRIILSMALCAAALQAAPLTGVGDKDHPFVNSLGMSFVKVPKTKILMCIHETRRKDYAAYAAENPNAPAFWKKVEFEGVPVGDSEDHPVVMVSWDEANAFCAWLSRKDGRTFRLPTDLEWSAAIGIKNESPSDSPMDRYTKRSQRQLYPWGHSYPPPAGAGNYAGLEWQKAFPSHQLVEGYLDQNATTAPVMSFKPNELGIFDLGGNVWEWCSDWNSVTQTSRTARGGAWFFYERDDILSAFRGGLAPSLRRPYYGFRVVVEMK